MAAAGARVAGFIVATAAALTTLSGCAPAEASAVLTVIEGEVGTVDSSGDAVEIESGSTVPSGTTITTAADGFVELAWPDGSVTRLGSDTEFIANSEGTRGELMVGTVWNRLTDEVGDYRVITPEGTVQARAAAFVLKCSADCVALVLDGEVTLDETTIDGPVSAGLGTGLTDQVPLPWDAVFASPFAIANSELDEALGFKPASDLYAGADPALASINGTFSGTRTVTSFECNRGDCSENPQVGDVADRSYTFEVDCSSGLPCIGQALTQSQNLDTRETEEDLVPLTFDGTTYSWELLANSGPYCFSGGDGFGNADNLLQWSITATEAAVVGNQFVATAIAGTASGSLVITGEAGEPGCADIGSEWESRSDVAATLDGL